MKKSAATIMNGTKYPGDVNAVDCFVSAAIEDWSPLPENVLPGEGLVARFALQALHGCLPAGFISTVVRLFAPHNTIRKTRRRGSDVKKRLSGIARKCRIELARGIRVRLPILMADFNGRSV
jgi:hypothetical protein